MGENKLICGPEEVFSFWFQVCSREDWFRSSAELDREIGKRFQDTHRILAGAVPEAWRRSPESMLSAVILFDQFPRNIYRGTPLAFATDGLALREAKAALEQGADLAVPQHCRAFFYMPFEHSEDIAEQERSVELFGALGDEEYLDFAVRHRDVIARYGRFPHRNAILGRLSTAEELEYISRPGSGF